MANVFITCVMYCCTQVLTPTTKWGDTEELVLRDARGNCKNIDAAQPCLVRLQKMDETWWRATCGRNNNE